ncbi:hypothetical protein ABIA22_006048 [Sinorhizobium fredii]|nr:hypothetical protein AB395_00006054 [Sinorhizobium fredii CCBAU 45436]
MRSTINIDDSRMENAKALTGTKETAAVFGRHWKRWSGWK